MDSSTSRPRRKAKAPKVKQPSANAANSSSIPPPAPLSVVTQYRRIDDDIVFPEDRLVPGESDSGKCKNADDIEKVIDIIRKQSKQSKHITNARPAKVSPANQLSASNATHPVSPSNPPNPISSSNPVSSSNRTSPSNLSSSSKVLPANQQSSSNQPPPSNQSSSSKVLPANQPSPSIPASSNQPSPSNPSSSSKVLQAHQPSPSIPFPSSIPVASASSPKPTSSSTQSSSSESPPREREQFTAFGIEAYPTRARFNEICRKFVTPGIWCEHGGHCYRIHPLDKRFYYSVLSEERRKRSEFVNIHTTQDVVEETKSDVEIHPDPVPQEKVLPSSSEEPSWDFTGLWQYRADTEAWTDSSSASDDSSQGSSIFSSLTTSSRTSVAGDSESSFQTVTLGSESQPPYVCWDWLCGNCTRVNCKYLHQSYDNANDSTQLPISQVTFEDTTSSRTSVARNAEAYIKTVTGGSDVQPRNVCWDWLGGKCARVDCKYLHQRYDNVSDSTQLSVSQVTSEDKLPRSSGQWDVPVCRDWGRGNCTRGESCPFVHVDEKGKGRAVSSSPLFYQHDEQLCKDWGRGNCLRGVSCPFVHEERAKGHSIQTRNLNSAQITVKPPRPRFNETCRDWRRNQCLRGARCYFIHEDIEYDDNTKQMDYTSRSEPQVPFDQFSTYVPKKPPEQVIRVTVHDHIKLSLSDGFQIKQLITGFESCWLFISNVPRGVHQENVLKLLQPFGTISDVHVIPDSRTSTVTFKIRMSCAEEASQASASLNGTKEFGNTIAARLSVTNSSSGNGILSDTTVRVIWEAPGKVAYAGYSRPERAYEAIRKTANIPMGDRFVKAEIHSGLPAVGAVTVRFRGVPVNADENSLREFAEPEDVVWERPNYVESALTGIQRLLQPGEIKFIKFEMGPRPYKDARIVAHAHYATPTEAKIACENISGRKPTITGLTKIHAEHLKSISYSLNTITFKRLYQDIESLRRRQTYATGTKVHVIEPPSGPVTVRLCSPDLQKLGWLKVEMESILTGEIVKRDGKVVWDDFFGRMAGAMFVLDLERRYSGMNVERHTSRRMIRLFGPLSRRRAVRDEILRKVDYLRAQRVHTVHLEGRLIGIFMNADLMKLQEKLGPENVILDLQDRCLRIRGDENTYIEAQEIVDAARLRHPLERGKRRGPVCPVCLDVAAESHVSLWCGHTWCRSCLKSYLEAAKTQKLFPLTCLGDEARCTMRIPLGAAREILSIADFEELTHAAFSAHVHTHPDEFHFCPTPDCAQVYRPSKTGNGASIQCPSCLVRICSQCHAEAHEGLGCIEVDNDGQFKEWVKTHDVKNCPGCNIPIERAEGCNHITCTRCNTHTCWVCLATFPGGEGIYGHMRIAHGGFGLGPIE